MLLLAGDVGGTNTRLVIAAYDKETKFNILIQQTYQSADFNTFEEILSLFLNQYSETEDIYSACFAVAGPVIDNQAKITNLPWLISGNTIKNQFNLSNLSRVTLINDFYGMALGISYLDESQVKVIQQGHRDSKDISDTSPDAVVLGAGTGLGVAHRVFINNEYHILPSETGHTSFAPSNERQTALLCWLQKRMNHVSLETVLSGSGLYRIYEFLCSSNPAGESKEVRERMQGADPAVIITEYGLSGQDTFCREALDLFVEIYAAIAGDVALHYYPLQEVYITGGIGYKISERIDSKRFIQAFSNKGLMKNNLESVSIKLALTDDVGLYGALATAIN